MKRILPLLIFGLIATLPAWSQEPVQFNILFNGAAPTHAPFLPPGGGVLQTSNFSAAIFLADTAPLSGRILELENDSSFQMISPLNIVLAGYPPANGQPGGTAYSLEQTLPLNSSEMQNLLAGRWYAEVVIGQNTYLGQFVLVPEPASATLLLCGVSLVLLRRRRRV